MIDEIPIKKFLGLNLQDAADKVADNEFVQLQNVYQPTKGTFSRRWGSVLDSSSFSLASRISGVWRHYAPNKDRFSIYHCAPDATLLPDNTTDLTLTDLADGLGNIFGGGSVTALRVCYSWIGRGLEQTYNTRNRSGFGSLVFPLNASANTSHQSITVGGTTHSLQIDCPAFPTGVTGANIFVARGTSTQMTYAGTITTSAGRLVFREFIGSHLAQADDPVATAGTAYATTGGSLPPGIYHVAMAWVTDPNVQEGGLTSGISFGGATQSRVRLRYVDTVNVQGAFNAIAFPDPGGPSTNGAQGCYCFVGTAVPTLLPLVCVGLVRSTGSGNILTIGSIPSHNAQSIPYPTGPDSNDPIFVHQVNDSYQGPTTSVVGQKIPFRFGFLMAKKAGQSLLQEIFPSRSMTFAFLAGQNVQIYQGDTVVGGQFSNAFIHNYMTAIRTDNDLYTASMSAAIGTPVQPYPWANAPIDPNFCYQLGISYFANGCDIPWMTDGYVLGQLSPMSSTTQTLLPPIPRYISVFQSSLIAFGNPLDNALYASNANAPQNWATGGAGALLRFVQIGDAVGSGGTALGIFTPATEATSNPGSFLIGFKKNGTWMIAAIPDPAAATLVGQLGQVGSPMVQISGRVGCVAYHSIVQAPQGTIFLGQDANVYLIRAVSEPVKIGTKIQNALSHLVGNDTAMKCCTAVYHDNHYKISFPSVTAIATSPIVNDSEFWADLRTQDGNPITWVGPHAGRNIGPQVVLVGDSDDLSRLVADASSVVRTYTADSTAALWDLASNGDFVGISAKIKSKIYRLGKSAHLKRHLGAFLDMYIDESYANTVLYEAWMDSYYNNVNRTLPSGSGVWDGSDWDQSYYADAAWQGFDFLFGQNNLVGRTLQWAVSTSDMSPFSLSEVALLVKTERRRSAA